MGIKPNEDVLVAILWSDGLIVPVVDTVNGVVLRNALAYDESNPPPNEPGS